MSSERQLFLQHIAQTSDIPLMLEIEKADGIYLYDKSGKKYIDLISGISVSNLGHNNKKIINAIKDQVDKHMHLMVYGEYVQSVQVQLAAKLTGILPEKLNSVYFVNSGTEANEGAVKLAKRVTGKSKIITFENAYHGSSQGSLSLMGNEEFKNAFRPLIPGIKICEYNHLSSVNEIDSETAAVIIEPIQGEAGIRVPSVEFLTSLRKKCNDTGTLLIFDEIQTGFGRTGKMFGFQHFNVIPDIITFAKGLGGGMPLGAFVSDKNIMNQLTYNPVLGHITTFGGHPVSCAASLESLNILLEENFIHDIEKKEMLFRSLLQHNKIKEIRGKGLFLALQLNSFDQVLNVIKKAMLNGLIIDWFLFCNNAIRIAPPLIISENEIEEACKILIEAVDQSYQL